MAKVKRSAEKMRQLEAEEMRKAQAQAGVVDRGEGAMDSKMTLLS